LQKKACHRRSFRAHATAGSLFPRMRWPLKPPFPERSWRSINRRFGAVALRDQDLPALFKGSNSNGSERSRLPVAAKIAFETAGAMGGTPGSPRRLVRFSDMNVHGWHIRLTATGAGCKIPSASFSGWKNPCPISSMTAAAARSPRRNTGWRTCQTMMPPWSGGGPHGVGDGGSRGGMACASDQPARRSTGLSPSPKFQHSSGADVSPVLPSARACRADSDPVRTHDGATHAVANRSAIDLTKRRGFFAGARSRRAGRAPS
jgi:hypothetical protein